MSIVVDKKDTKPIEQEESASDKDVDYEYFRNLREKYNIHINKQKAMSFMDYVSALELDTGVVEMFQRKKSLTDVHVYYLDIEMQNGSIEKSTLKWTIRRRFEDFVKFEKELNEELAELKFPKEEIPQLSSFHDLKSEGDPEAFLEAAESFLRALMSAPEVRAKSTVLYEFIELSLLPLPNGPRKLKEGYLRKKGGGRFKRNKLRLYASYLFTRWQERWFLLTEEGIIYTVDSNSTRSREMLLFDQSFQIEYGRKATGSHTGISLVTPNRVLNLQANDNFEALDWIGEIQKAAKASPYTKINRYLSFAPKRDPVHYCKSYVDGEGYFADLYEALILAKREVFITDWWLTPELSLKRPIKEGETQYRLDQVLGRIANSGVKVYVIVYHEVKMMMYNDSEHAKNALEALSSNITVLKHPSEPFFSWSHHEKLVVIDQTVGFIGGFDLCFGRWDTNAHPINDPALEEGKGDTYHGQDYANPRLADFRNVREQPDTALVDKTVVPRMPFHDAMIKVIGPVIADMARHFIQYWNHVAVDVYGKQEEAPLPKNNLVPPPDDMTVKKDNATIKLRNAFRKIVGLRHLAGGGPLTNLNSIANNVASLEKKDGENEAEDKEGRQEGKLPKETKETVKPKDEEDKFYSERVESQPEGPHAKKGEDKEVLEEKKKAEKKESKAPSAYLRQASLDASLKELIEEAKHNENKSDDSNTKTSTEASSEAGQTGGSLGLLNSIKDKGVALVTHIKDAILPGSKPEQETEIEKNVMEEDEDTQEKNKYSSLIKNIQRKERDYDNNQRQLDKPELRKHYHAKAILESEEKFKKQVTDQFYEKSMLQLLFSPKEKVLEGTIACQMVRSASKWSLGLNSNDGGVENSIQNAYIEIIQNSKNFIYIENQFFMSGTAGKELQNEVGQALVYRIEKAHLKKERFRVLIFLPLLPAFEGEIVDSKAALLKVQVYWQYMTICRGENSIYATLRKKGITPEDYIQFYSLRQHGRMSNGEPSTEMIYIHSKILVADDDILLIGSANINDRSLQGSRDSEIAMIFEDDTKIPSVMNGKEVKVSEFVATFRRKLLGEHMGLSDDEVKDPISEEFTKLLNERTETNTLTYREIFACYPDDTMKTLKDIDEIGQKRDLSKYDELAPKLKGHVVWYPLSFLAEDQLTPSMTTVEYYVPGETFV